MELNNFGLIPLLLYTLQLLSYRAVFRNEVFIIRAVFIILRCAYIYGAVFATSPRYLYIPRGIYHISRGVYIFRAVFIYIARVYIFRAVFIYSVRYLYISRGVY